MSERYTVKECLLLGAAAGLAALLLTSIEIIATRSYETFARNAYQAKKQTKVEGIVIGEGYNNGQYWFNTQNSDEANPRTFSSNCRSDCSLDEIINKGDFVRVNVIDGNQLNHPIVREDVYQIIKN